MSSPIPLELVLAGRDLTEPRSSPDGRLVAFVQRGPTGSALTVVPALGGPERLLPPSPPPAPGRGLGGGCFDWLPDGRGLVYAASDGELWLAGRDGGTRRLTTRERECRAPSVAPDGASVVCVVDEAEVWSVALDGAGERRLDDGADGFCFDPAVAPNSTTVAWQAWSAPSMPWDDAHVVTARPDAGAIERWRPDGAAVQQPRFLPDGRLACVHDATGWLNVAVGEQPIVAEPVEHAGPTWGMGQRSYAPSPDGGRVAFTRNEDGFGRLCVTDLATGSVNDVGRGVHGQLSWRGDGLVALRSGARTPTEIVRYGGAGLVRSTLAVGPAWPWDEFELPEPEPVVVDHDGIALHARRYVAGEGRMLCWVHGGPTDQWMVDFRPRIAYWWSRGWDVLVVDPRGTTGHGRAYQRALDGGWGLVDVDDTAASIAFAQRQGWAGPSSTVAIGASSGGMTVLALLADHPELVAGGIASFPVSDLSTLSGSTHRFEAHYTGRLVGPVGDAAYAVRSPITKADRIAGPLLVFHGRDDPVVPVGQSEALAERIRAAGGDVDLVVYDGEGHGIRDPANVVDEYRRTEHFLAARTG